jgi:aminoglycoside 3-N-acetyltransferase
MKITKSDIADGFKGLGLSKGNIVLMHSSLRSFGYVEGGAETVIASILETVGDEGCVMVPTLTGSITDTSGNPPVFDVSKTSCWTGRIPETFRTDLRAKRSLHPTHSVAAIGMKTQNNLIEGHEKGRSPCDECSPYYKNALAGGYILLIGVDQECNTTVHCCEEIAGVPYHLQEDMAKIDLIGYSGECITVFNRLHNWHKPPTDFNKFDDILLSKHIAKISKIGNSTIRLINAGDMLDTCVGILKKHPKFLLKNA